MTRSLPAVLVLLLICVPAAWGQSIFNQTTGSWHTSGNWTPSGVPGSGTTVHVGTTGTNRTANISTAGASSANAYIGVSSGNLGTIIVTGQTWTNSGQIVSGYGGTGVLTIQSAGVVNDASGVIGYQSGSNGTATVTGANSQWNHTSYLSIGDTGTGQLNIQSGGLVTSASAYLGYYSGGNGTVTVNGTGSQWTNSGTIEIGRGGSGTMNVQSGGVVSDTTGFIGTLSGSTGAVTVTGSGSQWNNSNLVSIGNDGTGTLTVSDGGKVTTPFVRMAWTGGTATLNLNGTSGSRGVLETAAIGEGTGSGGGTINFNGGILRATANQADFLQNFEAGNVQILSGGAFFDTNGFNVTVNSTATFGGTGGITKQGAGTLTLSGIRTFVGNNLVEAGTLQNTTGRIASNSGSAASMTVSGVGSQWINSGLLSVGVAGTDTLTIQSGGVVSSATGLVAQDGGGSGTVTVNGTGSTWNNAGTLEVGRFGSAALNIQSGGTVSSSVGVIASGVGTGNIGSSFGASTATVSGSGSQWTNSDSLFIGQNLNGTLTADAGGKVTAVSVTLALGGLYGAGTLNLTGTVGSRGVLETSYISEGTGTGGGTINLNGGILRATGNQADFLQNFEAGDVQIQSGGAFFDTNGFNVTVNSTAQFGGTGGITKQGAGTLTLSGDRIYNGTSRVEGGTLSNATGTLGNIGSNSSMTIAGAGSQWTNNGYLAVGNQGTGTLNIQNGGTVSNTVGYVGANSGGIGTATVTDSGSQWTNASYLTVGYDGNGTLNIQSGGVVSNTAGYIGFGSGSISTATVAGSGSQWLNSQELRVGDAGNGTLTVSAGGKVTAPNITLAFSGTGSTGTLNLNGTTGSRGVLETASISEGSGTGGSTINFNGGILRATGNQSNFLQNFEGGDVQIQSGGAYFDTNGYNVTVNSTATFGGTGSLTKQGAGTLTLTGSNTYGGGTEVKSGRLEVATGGSINHSGAGLWVGDTAGDNGSLTISGGTVTANGSRIGHYAGAVGAATISGGTWSSSGQLFVGYDGTGTLDITGGMVTDGTGVLGYGHSNAGAVGTATVSGGTWNNTSTFSLIIGGNGTGTLNLTDGGIVNAANGSGTVHLALGVGTGTGTLNIGTGGTAGTLNAAAVNGENGTATVNFNHTGSHTFNTQLTGSLAVNKLGSGTTTLSGTNTYTGATMVLQGKVLVDGSIAASFSVDVSSGASLGGHGTVSTITGAGIVGPGNSPGILTATSIDPSGGIDFLFEMTQTGSPFYDQAAASGNDVLRLTGATPFISSLTAANTITVDFTNYGILSNGLVFRGGFYTDNAFDFYSQIQNASFNYLGLGAGESVLLSTVLDSANFAGGSSNGYVTQFTIMVPEPSRVLLMMMGMSGALLRRRRKT